jgi:hypothetical protein
MRVSITMKKFFLLELQFDEMATKLGEIPDKTKDLVNSKI